MDCVRPKQEEYASLGFFTVAIDTRWGGAVRTTYIPRPLRKVFSICCSQTHQGVQGVGDGVR
jgi:hypothetical protein